MNFTVEKNKWGDVSVFLIDFLKKSCNNKATVITLSGDLGSGKTTLVKEIAESILVEEKVVSPTFVILKKYKINNKDLKFKNLIHIDAYRIEKQSELEYLKMEDFLENKDNLIMIEWPENIENIINRAHCNIQIEHIDEESRKVKILL